MQWFKGQSWNSQKALDAAPTVSSFLTDRRDKVELVDSPIRR